MVEAKNKEKEKIREKQEREQENHLNKSETEIIKASSKVVQFKKLGKIDLNSNNEAAKTVTKEKSDQNASEKVNQVEDDKVGETLKKDNYKKLSGLTSTGEKIDLDNLKQTQSEPPKTKSKKRRRRIVSKQEDSFQNNVSGSKSKHCLLYTSPSPRDP